MIGTTVVYPHGDERLRAQEVGASIFVEANRHLVKAAKVGQALCVMKVLIEVAFRLGIGRS